MKKNATNTMLMWNAETGDVLLKPWPETGDKHGDYSSGLACWVAIRNATFEQRKTIVFIEAMHLIVRDGIDPLKLHTVLLGLEEYRAGCSADMPGANKSRQQAGEENPGIF
jgi:hypothetical protein